MSIEQKLSTAFGVASIVVSCIAGIFDSLNVLMVGAVLGAVAIWMDSI